MKRIGLLVLLLLSNAGMRATELLPLEGNYPAKEFAPAASEVKATLRLPKIAMIGESIPAELVIENTGSQPLELTLGGDYRATGYPQRVKVRVQDSQGTELPQAASRPSFGGMVNPKRIEPGKSEAIEFPLDCYAEFSKAGTYVVTAGHDLGWRVDPAHPHPIPQASLTITEPNAAEAAAYVDKLFFDARAAPESEREWRLEKQLCVLRHPAYLSALVEKARGGSTAAVKGIGHIATPEATGTLLSLLESQAPAIAATAADQLLRRVPVRDDEKGAPSMVWDSPYQIQPLLPVSWREEFSAPLVASAVKLLESADADEVEAAARLLRARGGPEHAPAPARGPATGAGCVSSAAVWSGNQHARRTQTTAAPDRRVGHSAWPWLAHGLWRRHGAFDRVVSSVGGYKNFHSRGRGHPGKHAHVAGERARHRPNRLASGAS